MALNPSAEWGTSRLSPRVPSVRRTSSNTIMIDRPTPETLGKLVALYEHSVFTQGVVWDIDSFDQWGVERGKVLAQRIVPELESKEQPKLKHDTSINNLINYYRKSREKA